jgi:outer membrane biosynthesis protein TonB
MVVADIFKLLKEVPMKKLALLSIMLLAAGCASQDMGTAQSTPGACQIPEAEQTQFNTMAPRIKSFPNNKESVPKKALDAHMDGCASVKYKIDAGGHATNIKVLKEEPQGYGFGQTAVTQLKHTKFEKPAKANKWYWKISSWRLAK